MYVCVRQNLSINIYLLIHHYLPINYPCIQSPSKYPAKTHKHIIVSIHPSIHPCSTIHQSLYQQSIPRSIHLSGYVSYFSVHLRSIHLHTYITHLSICLHINYRGQSRWVWPNILMSMFSKNSILLLHSHKTRIRTHPIR